MLFDSCPKWWQDLPSLCRHRRRTPRWAGSCRGPGPTAVGLVPFQGLGSVKASRTPLPPGWSHSIAKRWARPRTKSGPPSMRRWRRCGSREHMRLGRRRRGMGRAGRAGASWTCSQRSRRVPTYGKMWGAWPCRLVASSPPIYCDAAGAPGREGSPRAGVEPRACAAVLGGGAGGQAPGVGGPDALHR